MRIRSTLHSPGLLDVIAEKGRELQTLIGAPAMHESGRVSGGRLILAPAFFDPDEEERYDKEVR